MTQLRFNAAALTAAIAAMLGLGPQAAGAANGSDKDRASEDTGYALVQLDGEPLATDSRTQPPKGRKIDFTGNTARAYRAQLANLRNSYKAWLRAHVPAASVSGEFDVSLNAVAVKLNGASLAQVSAASMVKLAQYQGLYYPSMADPGLALTNAEQAWARSGGTPATAGAGVKVAIVDSGIDLTHPCFFDVGYAPQAQLGDRRFTNNKVIAARVFSNKQNQNGASAEAVGDHGTHVAGTVACNHQTPASVDGVAIPYAISGVAPRALLGNYNVFPGAVAQARSEDILNALDAAYGDGFDVANLSLAGATHGAQDLLMVAVDNLDQANMVVATANGNDGPGYFTAGSPGEARRALSAGAASVPHFVGARVSTEAGSYLAASGDFATVVGELNAPLGVIGSGASGLGTACSALAAGAMTGKIVLLARGGCTFTTKVRNAQAAGAAAALVSNDVAGDPTAMGGDGGANPPTLPAYMVSIDDGQALLAAGSGAATTIAGTRTYLQSTHADIMAGFSGQGPSGVDLRVKPDVVAPGVNVLSSVPHTACAAPPCFAFLSGTSMASPQLAGSAAVVRAQHPDWSAADVRSAVVNTAERGVLKSYDKGLPVDDVNIVGAGLVNAQAAVNAVVALDPVSLSFGGVPAGSGQTRSQTLTLSNLGSSAKTFGLVAGNSPNGARYAVSPASVSLAPGGSATVVVTMRAAAGAPTPFNQAWLDITESGQTVAHAALMTMVK